MVQGIPYIHWKIINERAVEEIDENYIWATTVEAPRGPMLEPVFVSSAEEAQSLFGIDLKPFFANGGRGLYVVRVGVQSQIDPVSKEYVDPVFKTVLDSSTEEKTPKLFSTAHSDIKLGKDFVYKRVAEKTDGNGTPIRYAYTEAGEAEQVTLDTTNGKYTFASEAGVEGHIEEAQTLIQKTAEEVTISASTPLIDLDTRYYGEYSDIQITISEGLRKGSNITIKDSSDSLVMTNVDNLARIIKRIDDRQQNIYAQFTQEGEQIQKIVSTSTKSFAPLEEEGLTAYKSYAVGTLIDPSSISDVSLLPETKIVSPGSNGYWDKETGRVPEDYQALAHKDGLALLEAIRLGGIFCLYQEDAIQKEYILHGNDYDTNTEERYGMNSDTVCRWRMILLGASEDQDNYIELEDRAITLNDQYVLFLGQGLVETFYDDYGNKTTKLVHPYEATQYVAGLRSGLFYGDAIFGGESKKEIKSAYDDGSLEIAPLYPATESKLIWEPYEYERLNEVGVLTFTTEYNQLTLTDGVTTRQDPKEEDEEGVISILKWAQHKVRDACIPYIGRNITGDLNTAVRESIVNVLEEMQSTDQTLISLPSEGINAYEVEVVTNPRKIQLVGKIYVHLKITPVHALRQIEVDMTVQ